MDVKGAVLSGPDSVGYYSLLEEGYISTEYLELVPGIRAPSPKFPHYRIPANLVPNSAKAIVNGLQPGSSDGTGFFSKTPTREQKQQGYCPYPIGHSSLLTWGHQQEAHAFLLSCTRGGLLCLGVGLGKTLTACETVGDLRPVVIFGPLQASTVWCPNDSGKPTDPEKVGWKVQALRSTVPEHDKMAEADAYFINYEIAKDWKDWLAMIQPKAVIVDEADELRNWKTTHSKVIRKLARLKSIQLRLALTATPIIRTVADLWALLDFCQPGLWGSSLEFRIRYAGAYESEWGWKDGDETNVDELKERLSRVMFLRSAVDVGKELPPMEREVARLPRAQLQPEAMRRYDRYSRDVHALVKRGDWKGVTLQQISACLVELSLAKTKPACEAALAMLDEAPSLIVFCWYKDIADAVAKFLRSSGVHVWGPITSDTTKKKRDLAVADFALAARMAAATADARSRLLVLEAPSSGEEPKPLRAAFVCTLGVGAKARNELCAAPAELFVDLYWNPSLFIQAEGRIMREGQTATKCKTRYLVAENTIDEFMFSHIQRKATTILRVSGNDEAQTLADALGGHSTKKDFEELLKAIAEMEPGSGELDR